MVDLGNTLLNVKEINIPLSPLDDSCKCGCKRMDHRKGAKTYGACRMCLTCHKFKLPKPAKPIKSKVKR